MRIKVLLIILILVSASFPQNEEIGENIRILLKKIPLSTSYSILVINPMLQDTIFAHNTELVLPPASVTKLYTTIPSLALMGADYKIETRLYTDDFDLSDGVINGNLYIKGFGNALFSSENLKEMVAFIASGNINRITGDLLGDDSYFDKEYSRADWIEDEAFNSSVPPLCALILNRNQIQVRKKVRRRRYKIVNQGVENPPVFVATALKNELINQGILVEGVAAEGEVPKEAMQLTSHSVKLLDFISVINKRSDNFLAECMFKALGAFVSKKEGSGYYSTKTIMDFLESEGIDHENVKIVDGSGLSRANQVTTQSIVSLLEWAYLDESIYNPLLKSLSVAGNDGTLRGRMRGSNAEYNFRGKTGTLNGLISIAGYLTIPDGDDLIVSIVFQFSKGRDRFYRGIEDRIIEELAGYKSESGFEK